MTESVAINGTIHAPATNSAGALRLRSGDPVADTPSAPVVWWQQERSIFIATPTLDADLTVAAAQVRIEGSPPGSYVVVRRTDGLDTYWHRVSVRVVQMTLSRNLPDTRLIDALDLNETTVADVYDVATVDPSDAAHATGVLLDGDRALGVLDPGLTDTMRGRRAAVATTSETGTTTLDPEADDDEAFIASGFSAFPHLNSPPYAVVGVPIDLVVTLERVAQEGTSDAPVTVDTELDEFDLIVQVIADGFAMPGVREILHVDRLDLGANEARFTLIADPIAGPAIATKLEVEFSFGGVVCGRAWRSIAIVNDESGGAAAHAPFGGASVVVAQEVPDPPDLEVSITENEARTALHWRFTSLHPIEIPTTAVLTSFREHNAQTFAQVQIREAHRAAGSPAVANRMLGIARAIADEMPPEFWQVLGRVWMAKQAEADPLPAVLFSSSDTLIPWELASTESEYVDPALVDDTLPPFLGAQIRIGRWMKSPLRGRSGRQNPLAPPPAEITINRIALVVGDYLARSGQRPLPMAGEEGNALATLYPSVRLAATFTDLGPLFNGELEVDGEALQPTALHFACHGAVEPNNPEFNGIVLSEGNQRLDELYVRGNRLAEPLVFLNACQLGTASEQIGDYGGMASAFLKTGCRGFVAPLWSVSDQTAYDVALEFYASTIDDGVEVGEVLRRQRAKFDMTAGTPDLTYLAYIYYGHPRMKVKTL